MRVDVHFYGSAPMRVTGSGVPEPTERRASNADVVACYANLCHWAGQADRLGFDTMWLR